MSKCEWTEDKQARDDLDMFEAGCDMETPVPRGTIEETWNVCPVCTRPIEIVETDHTEFELGDLVKHELGGYGLIKETGLRTTHAVKCETAGDTGYWKPKYIEKIGHFRPTEEFFDRLPDKAKGELVIPEDNTYEGIYLWPYMRVVKGYLAWGNKGSVFDFGQFETTGIVLSVSDLREIFQEEQ